MPRYAFKIEYHGAAFAGWQRQADQPSVQGAIETALARLEPRDHTIAAAGRTDAGVHATAQVAHADLAKDWDPFRLSEALNFHLKPAQVAIVACARVEDDFHARFSAIERRYLFRLVQRRAPMVHERGLVWRVQNPLDVQAMRAGAAHLIGHHAGPPGYNSGVYPQSAQTLRAPAHHPRFPTGSTSTSSRGDSGERPAWHLPPAP